MTAYFQGKNDCLTAEDWEILDFCFVLLSQLSMSLAVSCCASLLVPLFITYSFKIHDCVTNPCM